MNEAHDPLETELQALRPHEPSLELRQRIADRLASLVPLRSRRLRRSVIWGSALAAGVAAACLLVVAILLRREREVAIEPETPESPRPLLANAFDDALPTLWTYRRALAQSPEELDALLDRHAVLGPEPNSPLAPVRAFTRFDAELHALPGEL